MELLISTTPRANPARYQDGDIVCAFSTQRILWSRAQIVTKPDGFNSDGLRAADSLCYRFHHYTSKYMFRRVSLYEVERTDLDSEEVDLIDDEPNSLGEYMHVVDHLDHTTSQSNHLVFGSLGSEVWFGGRREFDYHDLWTEVIEQHSAHLHDDNLSWRFSEREKHHFLCLSFSHSDDEHGPDDHGSDEHCHCGNCDNILGERLSRCILDEDLNIVRKRACSVPYWELVSDLDIDVDAVRNPEYNSDARKTPEEGRPDLDASVSEVS